MSSKEILDNSNEQETSDDKSAPCSSRCYAAAGVDYVSELLERKIKALEWAIHSCNKRMRDIREDEILTEEQKERQIDAHESYLRTLFAMRDEAGRATKSA